MVFNDIFFADLGTYIIEKQGDDMMKANLAHEATTTFVSIGSQLIFTPEGSANALVSVTSTNVMALTTKATLVYVAVGSDGAGNTNCLKLDGIYIKGSDATVCSNQLWYFILCKFQHFFSYKFIKQVGFFSERVCGWN